MRVIMMEVVKDRWGFEITHNNGQIICTSITYPSCEKCWNVASEISHCFMDRYDPNCLFQRMPSGRLKSVDYWEFKKEDFE